MNHIAQNENDDFSVVLATKIAIYTKENAQLKKEIAAKRSKNAELKARILRISKKMPLSNDKS